MNLFYFILIIIMLEVVISILRGLSFFYLVICRLLICLVILLDLIPWLIVISSAFFIWALENYHEIYQTL